MNALALYLSLFPAIALGFQSAVFSSDQGVNTPHGNFNHTNDAPESHSLSRRWTLHNRPTTWPKDKTSPFTVINYCFDNEESFTLLGDHVQNAINKWATSISKFSKQLLAPAVKITRVSDDRTFCHLPGGGDWNPDVPMDTLMVQYIPMKEGDPPRDHGTAQSTTGYRAEPEDKTKAPGRHRLRVFETTQKDLDIPWVIAHEFGKFSTSFFHHF